jgi:hypothetical protein
VFTGNSISQSRRNWSDGPAKTEQEKILKDHWAVLRRLRGAEVTLSDILGQYHARGVVPLWRRPLCLCEMTTDQAPWTETVTALTLPMLPHEGTEKLVSHHPLDECWVDLCFSL